MLPGQTDKYLVYTERLTWFFENKGVNLSRGGRWSCGLLADKVPRFVRAVPGLRGDDHARPSMYGLLSQTGRMERERESPGEGLGSSHAGWNQLESIVG